MRETSPADGTYLQGVMLMAPRTSLPPGAHAHQRGSLPSCPALLAAEGDRRPSTGHAVGKSGPCHVDIQRCHFDTSQPAP